MPQKPSPGGRPKPPVSLPIVCSHGLGLFRRLLHRRQHQILQQSHIRGIDDFRSNLQRRDVTMAVRRSPHLSTGDGGLEAARSQGLLHLSHLLLHLLRLLHHFGDIHRGALKQDSGFNFKATLRAGWTPSVDLNSAVGKAPRFRFDGKYRAVAPHRHRDFREKALKAENKTPRGCRTARGA